MKNTKKLLLALSLTASFTAASFAGEEVASPISANVTITSDYVWRGLTQTDGEAAIQGGFDYAHESGFAAGVWGSNVDFESVAAVGTVTAAVNADVEFDLYASYSSEVNEFGYELGYIAYRYPGAAASNFEEVYLGGSYAGVGATYYFGVSDAEDYFELSYALPIEEVDLSVLYGDYDNSYDYYGVGIGKSFGGLDFALNYTNTDPHDGSNGESNTAFSISKSF